MIMTIGDHHTDTTMGNVCHVDRPCEHVDDVAKYLNMLKDIFPHQQHLLENIFSKMDEIY
jgi:hypothetical protein